jgi:hypothetical protein
MSIEESELEGMNVPPSEMMHPAGTLDAGVYAR